MFRLKSREQLGQPLLLYFQKKPSLDLDYDPRTPEKLNLEAVIYLERIIKMSTVALSPDEITAMQDKLLYLIEEARAQVETYRSKVGNIDYDTDWEANYSGYYDEICQCMLITYWKDTAAGRQEYDQLRMQWITQVLCEDVANEGFTEAAVMTAQDDQRGCFRVTSRLQSIVNGTKQMIEKFSGVL